MASAQDKFDEDFEEHMHKILYAKPKVEGVDHTLIEYFGIFSLTDVNAPDRKLWYIYYCKQPEIDETVDRIFQKYGKKNVCELLRKPVLSGVSMRTRVKNHFSSLKWYVKGNILEAPPKHPCRDVRMAKIITDLYFEERKMLYNYICHRHNDMVKYWK